MIASILDAYWEEVRGNVEAIVPAALITWAWLRAKHKTLVEAHEKHSKHLESLLSALDPETETDTQLDRIADKCDEQTPGGIRAVIDAIEAKPKRTGRAPSE